jgi:hypothetical protein
MGSKAVSSLRMKHMRTEKAGNALIRNIDIALSCDRPELDESVFADVYESLSVIEKIVYEAVPIDQPARFQQVICEVRRANKTDYSQRILEAALSRLVLSGIVIETSKDVFVREIVKPLENDKDLIVAKKEPETQNGIADIFTNLFRMAEKLAVDAENLKVEINKAATEVDRQFAASEERSQKFKQLKELLSGIEA